MELRVLLFDDISDIGKLDGLFVDTNILQEISEITPSSLIDVSEDTVLELGVVLVALVVVNFFIHLVSEDVLVSQKVLDLRFINWHLLLVGPLHGVFVMLEGVLQSEVLLFTDFGKLLFEVVRAGLIDEIVR